MHDCAHNAAYCLSVYICVPGRAAVAVKQRPDYSCEGDRDPIAESNKSSGLSLQMFSRDMTAPSITAPHVRGRRTRVTQSKSHCHGANPYWIVP